MRAATAALSTLLLAGCAPVAVAPPYAGPHPADECGAVPLAGYVGRQHGEIPRQPPGALWRVVPEGAPMTRDLRPARLNIIYDPRTQRVLRIYCG